MPGLNALNCVGQNDLVSLRIICTMARNREYNVEDLDMYGNTALLKACYLGRLECACTLLEFGANIYAVNYFGQNALTLATYSGCYPLVRELLHRRSYKDFNLSSLIPASCVAAMQNHVDIEEYFMKIDPSGVHDQTVHGLGVHDLHEMVEKAKKIDLQIQSSQPTFMHHRFR
ncbi:DNA replication inhibitor plutonium [Drosophila subobscura]|uniref:DNA replication inhibitor plutonium n=1 Tax=Drosophila subobscura TaxID=7241 RepID=UPI00155A3FB1|nr:DNA replication inhibitor plutonium [Drosophila subobscura]